MDKLGFLPSFPTVGLCCSASCQDLCFLLIDHKFSCGFSIVKDDKKNLYRKLSRNIVLIPETLKKYLSLVFMVFFSLSLSLSLFIFWQKSEAQPGSADTSSQKKSRKRRRKIRKIRRKENRGTDGTKHSQNLDDEKF